MAPNQFRLCPFCDEEVKVNAIKCKHCGEWFDKPPSGQSPASGSHLGPPSGHHSGSPSGPQPSTPSGHTPLTGIHLVNQALGDRYEILEEIGRGGMATVYKAIQKSLKRPVALKVVHQNLLHDTEFVTRFHREAQLCASLNHPNIVTVYDEGEVSGVHFMAMEYLEGTDLHRLIRSRGRLTPEQTLQYLLPVAEALDYAHGKGYIHRDIKSANIFITGSGRVVLMDFGIAHAAAGTQLTRAGTVIGTPEYMSPEQAEGKKVDHRTDLYSLGVVMYECLAGRVPFSGENAMSTIFQLTRNEPDDKPLVQTPTYIRQFVTALLRKKPENRTTNAAMVVNNIRRIQQGQPYQDGTNVLADSTSSPTNDNTYKSKYQAVKAATSASNRDGRPSTKNTATIRKKVSPYVWLLLFIAMLLGGVLINHLATERQRDVARTELSVWQKAQSEQTLATFESYLLQYPDGEYADDALEAIDLLEQKAAELKLDEQAWKNAFNENSIAAYKAYLSEYPNGKYASDAIGKMRELEHEQQEKQQAEAERKRQLELKQREEQQAEAERQRQLAEQQQRQRDDNAWQRAQKNNTIAAYNNYLNDNPQGSFRGLANTNIQVLRDRKRTLETEGDRLMNSREFARAKEVFDQALAIENVARIRTKRNEAKSKIPFHYTDDFSRAGKTWDDFEDDLRKWQTKNGYFKGFSKKIQSIHGVVQRFNELKHARTFELSVDARHVQGSNTSGMGLFFAAEEFNRSQHFGVNGGGYFYFGKVIEDFYDLSWTSDNPSVKKSGNWNTLKVVYDGNIFHYYINGQKVSDADAQIYGNSVGVYFSGNIDEAWFNNLVIKAEY